MLWPGLLIGVMAGRAVAQNKLVEHRRHVNALVNNIMDKSDSVPLLLTVCHIVGDWLLSPRAPMAAKERSVLLSKMTNLDRLPEVAAQPLIHYFLKLINQLTLAGLNDTTVPATGQPPKTSWMSNPNLAKPYMMGLMCADPTLRADYFGQFYGTLPKTPGPRVMQLIKQDWEPLNQRFYLVVMVEALMNNLRLTAGSHLAAGARMIETLKTQPFSSDAMQDETPCREAIVATHEAFLRKLVDAKISGGRTLLDPLRMLLHLDITLSSCLWQVLLQAAWMTLNESQQNGMLQHLVTLMVKGLHRQSLYIPTSLITLNQGSPQNVIQALLQSFLRPHFPLLPHDLLGALAVHYNAWFHVLPIVEAQTLYQPPASTQALITSGQVSNDKHQWIQVLSELYTRLNEHDLKATLKRK